MRSVEPGRLIRFKERLGIRIQENIENVYLEEVGAKPFSGDVLIGIPENAVGMFIKNVQMGYSENVHLDSSNEEMSVVDICLFGERFFYVERCLIEELPNS